MKKIALTVAACALSLLAIPAAASAGTVNANDVAKPHPHSAIVNTSDKELLCLISNGSECWVTNGTGTQTTISSSGAANMTILEYSNGDSFQDGNGKCEYVNGNMQLMTGSIACADQADQLFTLSNTGSGEKWDYFNSNLYGTDVLTFNDTDGKPVWVEDPVSGTWDRWTAEVE